VDTADSLTWEGTENSWGIFRNSNAELKYQDRGSQDGIFLFLVILRKLWRAVSFQMNGGVKLIGAHTSIRWHAPSPCLSHIQVA
jgi:hypothetical protein